MQPKERRDFEFSDLKNGVRTVIAECNKYKKEFYSGIFLALLMAAIDPLATMLFGRFIDALGTSEHYRAFGTYSVPLFVAILIAWLIINILNLTLERQSVINKSLLEEYVRRSYLIRISEHLFRLPLSFHKSNKSGETQEKIITAANAGANIMNNLITFVPQSLSIVIFLFIIYQLNVYLFLFVLFAVAVFITISVITSKPMAALQKNMQRMYARIRGGIVDAVTNIRIIKDFGAENYQTQKARKGYFEEAIPLSMEYTRRRRNQNFLQNIVIVSTRVVVLITSIYFIRNGTWSIGDLVIANAYIFQLFKPFMALSNNWRDIENGSIAIQDVDAVLALPTEPYALNSPQLTAHLKGDIEFDHVSFGYTADRMILNDISFKVNSGDIIALVGESGVGKSSLIDLISAYHAPSSGRILIDGRLITEVPLQQLRHNIGTVTQELTLFNDTIKNNLKYGNFDSTDTEILEAARKAHCLDFIDKFPEKMEQMVGERGLKLSVGQKQRIAIARAILKNPQILILDEPTSALDAGSEKIITEALDELMQGKTTFVVAHRLSTVRRANTILVFKDGRIVESGTHDELLKMAGGEYRRLYELQIGLHA